MTTKNVQLKDMSGNNIMPKTLGSIVENTDGTNTWNLGGVEAGAQVNLIETVKVNGTALTPDANKAVNIVISEDAVYSIAKQQNADSGYAATYFLTADGTAVSGAEKIQIPLDMVVSSGEVKSCATENQPVQGLGVGDKYIEFSLANSSDKVIVPVADLVDVYTEGTGIDIASNVVSIDTSVVAQKATTLSGYGIADAYTKTQADAAFGNLTYEELS